MLVLRSPSPEVGIAARGEQRVADDHAGAEALGLVAVDAAVVVGQPVELEVGRQPVEADGDARRPVELVVGSIGPAIGSSDGSAKSNIARISASLAATSCVAGRRDARPEVVDLEHLDVRAELRVHGGEVGVQVEHARDRCGP